MKDCCPTLSTEPSPPPPHTHTLETFCCDLRAWFWNEPCDHPKNNHTITVWYSQEPPLNWPLTTFWLTDELSQWAPACKHTSLDNKQSVKKVRSRVVFENSTKALWGCEDRTVTSKARGVVCFACLSRWSGMSPGERSVMASPLPPKINK